MRTPFTTRPELLGDVGMGHLSADWVHTVVETGKLAFADREGLSSFWPRAASPGRLVVEGRLDDSVVAEPRRRGHDVHVTGDWELGRLSAVGRDPSAGFLKAAANPRGMQGYAVGR